MNQGAMQRSVRRHRAKSAARRPQHHQAVGLPFGWIVDDQMSP
jgi:hypothetical protein